MKAYKLITIILIGILLIGCGKLGDESDLLNEELVSKCSSKEISGNIYNILKEQEAILFLKKNIEEYKEPPAGCTWHVFKVNEMYDKVIIYTKEDTKEFIFREISYDVGAYSGNKFYYCDIPNGCNDYYVEFYKINK